MAGQTEDIPYNISDFATPEDEKRADEDQPNKSVLLEVSKEIANDIKKFSSLEGVGLPANATPEDKIAAFDQMAINKGLALHLEKYKLMIDSKIRELA